MTRAKITRLPQLWQEAGRDWRPRAILPENPGISREDGILFWGKTSLGLHHALGGAGALTFGIAPDERLPNGWVRGEHPWPGPGSFTAGGRLLEFFDELRRRDIRRLHVFLSGGASSLAWLRPAWLPEAELARRLRALYAAPLSIAELNRERAKLCALKGGGAGRWLRWLAPRVRPTVYLVSDVYPFDPVTTVGSGPFACGGIRHQLLADQRLVVRAITRRAEAAGMPLLFSQSGNTSGWKDWLHSAMAEIGRDREGLILIAGEPKIALTRSAGPGGRMSHLIASLALDLAKGRMKSEVEILGMATDGVDGTSGGSGAWMDFQRLNALSSNRELRSFFASRLRHFDSATALRRVNGIVEKVVPTLDRSNIQDVLMVRVTGKRLA